MIFAFKKRGPQTPRAIYFDEPPRYQL
jgi:hypothetical protein